MFFQALILSAALETGLISGGIFNYSDLNVSVWQDKAIYTTLETTVSYKMLYIGGQIDCYVTPIKFPHFSPFQMTYVLNAGLNLGNVKIGYEHSCFHPIQPYVTIIGNETKPKYEGSQDKFFVRIETK